MSNKIDYKDAYMHILDLAKKNSDAYEYCLNGLEKKLKDKEEELKCFDDEYFNGLTKKEIAMLAKKSIRLGAEIRELKNSIITLIDECNLDCNELKKHIRELCSDII